MYSGLVCLLSKLLALVFIFLCINTARLCICHITLNKSFYIKKVLSLMPSELTVLKQRITELEAESIKLKAKKAEVEARNAELIKQMMEKNNRRDARIAKLEQK